MEEPAIPRYLQSTYTMLKCAFPHGVSNDEYWPLMQILHKEMSFRAIADLLSKITLRDQAEVYNDASGFGLTGLPDPKTVDHILLKLHACGYHAWLNEKP